MIRAVIADDEPLVRENIRMRLDEHNDIVIVGECGTGTETIQKVNKLQPDLLFLDIQMPGSDGFGILANLKENTELQVIFITAYDQYAVEAFEVNAVDYLLKPIDSERFNKAVKRTRNNLNHTDIIELKTLLKNFGEQKINSLLQNKPERLAVKTKNKTRLIPVNEISYLEADGDYVKIVLCEDQKSYLKRDTMKCLADKMAPSFIRIHRSYIINSDKISEIVRGNANDLYVKLKSGRKLKVSGYYKSHLEPILQNSY